MAKMTEGQEKVLRWLEKQKTFSDYTQNRGPLGWLVAKYAVACGNQILPVNFVRSLSEDEIGSVLSFIDKG